MKAYNPRHWFSLIFSFHKTDSFRLLIPAMIGITVFSSILCYLDVEAQLIYFRSTTVMHSLLGFVISLLLVFRTNTAYDRWWEGRRLWGDLLNNSRNLMLKIAALVPSEKKHIHESFRILITNYAFALKEHLRRGVVVGQLEEHPILSIEQLKNVSHVPNKIALQLNIEANNLYRQNIINVEHLLYINEELRSFTNIMGGCERIKKTPIPYSYTSFIKRTIFIYVLTLPLGILHDLRWATVPIVLFVFYAFASFELLAEEIEDPFGLEANDLPIDNLANTIKKDLHEIIQ
jgi:ion channel-forming bestrophin family protein